MKTKKGIRFLAIVMIAGMLLTGIPGMVLQAEESLEQEVILENETEDSDGILSLQEEPQFIEIGEVVSGELMEHNVINRYRVRLEETGRLYVRPLSYSSEVPPRVDMPDLLNGGAGGRLTQTHYFDLKAGSYYLDIETSRLDPTNIDKYIGTYSFVLEFESAHEGDVVHKNIDFDTLYYGQIDLQEDEHYNCYYFDMEEDGIVDIELASWVPENDHGADQYLPYLKYELKEHDPYHDKSPIIDRFLDKQYYDRLFFKSHYYSPI